MNAVQLSQTPPSAHRPSVLLVDDVPANLIALSAVLKPIGVRIVEAASGAEALGHVEKEEFAVVLLDVQMPGMDGFEVAERMRRLATGKEMPIIFLTAIHRDDAFVRRGYQRGAADYITKPFDADVVRARVRAFVDLFEQREAVRRAEVAVRTNERDDALRKLVAFERIATAGMSTNDIHAFLRDILDVFVSGSDAADAATILLREGERLVTSATFGFDAAGGAGDVGEGFARRIAEERKPLETTSSEIAPLAERLLVSYGVPLVHADEVVGVALVGSRRVRAFPEHDKTLFGAVAERAAWAVTQHLRRTRLFEIERHARMKAEAASRAKDEFLATVSHELRTPLNAILGWTMAARAKASDELQRPLAIVERNARAQARIVEDLLDAARIAGGRMGLVLGEVTLEPVVRAAVDALKLEAEAKKLTVDLRIDPAAVVEGDSERLQQVAWNLLSNAIKFSVVGGHLSIEVSRGDRTVTMRVVDDGEGIDPAFLGDVFEPFRQGDPSSTRRHSGLGLGLAIVKHLVDAHHGTVIAESDGVGHGARFTVTLPVVTPPAPSSARRAGIEPSLAPEDDGELRLDDVKILVVDDEPAERALVVDVLRDRGAIVQEAGSASEGFREVLRSRPHLVVSDIAMPGGDGYGFVRAMRGLPQAGGGQTPAIALIASPRGDYGERAIAAGFQAYLPKPVDVARLVSIAVRFTRKREET